MPLSPGLWNDLTPPEMWISLSTLDRPEDDYITVTVRIKEAGRRSISATAPVTRYAPSASIIQAVGKAVTAMEVAQAPLTGALLTSQLRAAILNWVDPF